MTRANLSLTFDDGPDPLWSARILAELDRCAARATFFVIGEHARGNPSIVTRALDRGHEIALHCHRHVRHSELSESEIEADTRTALRTLVRLGVQPARWRTPWGVQTAATVRVAERFGLELVGWTIDTHDWRGDPAAAMLARAKEELSGSEQAIVLMHDGLGPGAQRAGCEQTLALLEPLTALARARGLVLDTLAANAGAPCALDTLTANAGAPVAADPARADNPVVPAFAGAGSDTGTRD